jgi:predicted Zn-ribbon and HTH transcriptional regulator
MVTVKQKRMTHYCINNECGWEETSHKVRDGIKCPKCKGPVISVESKKTLLGHHLNTAIFDEVHEYKNF